MDPPVTRYLPRDGHGLAYQVVGEGPVDVVWFLEIQTHLDLMWTDPHLHYLIERNGTFGRSVYFQRRGIGLSDPLDRVPSLEEQADDVLAVMDEVGMRRATLVGVASTCGPQCLVAARAPDRVAGLVLVQPFAERLLGGDGEPHGWTPVRRAEFVDNWRTVGREWGSGASVRMWEHHADNPYNRRLMAMLERCSATPTTTQAHLEWIFRLDYSSVLPSIQCPARVLLPAASPVPRAAAEFVARQIPRGSFHLLPNALPGASLGEAWRPILDHVEELATGMQHPVDADRSLASLLFTDIVGSTKLLARIGDGAYRDLRAAHERRVRAEVEQAGGRLVKVTGDGTLSLFDGPAAAVRCAARIRDDARGLGIEIRAGIHTGTVEHAGPELTGLSVHIGARIGATAGPGEILVSRTARDLGTGSGLRFADRGRHRLAGVPGRWQLYALTDAITDPPPIAHRSLDLSVLDRAVLRTARRAPQVLRAVAALAHARQHRQAR
ncbi:cyclase [Rhodococcus sp. WB1]|uniref:adenylate/guanylate cyclase domain-containing protein n=1 Tax=unclassified Rhodococcus (in: high G+C Gram-positive bacteria) TaxID=192944 RepID=UPI00081AA69A|nr:MULTISPECIES: adenylate/guanylate cyclase domain-containing protein [unclassified Rhodococcus (in: high G+C Gram-positive bacteria)]ANZ27396.1 cyclase [Rhodococcus sp. WB1]USC15527.1 adenylate/guanylate cyclase domain-containing protein [Rhodococcus sp. 11-3]